MQIFEFQFNPKKKDRRVETLSYEREDQNRNLYLIGEIKEVIPGNEKFLLKIMKMIKEEYSSRDSDSPEEALKGSLLKANEYLAVEIARDNIGWLGNMHLVAVSVSGNKVNIAKIGNAEVFLINYGKFNELNGGSIESLDAKAFGTVISGKLGKGERISVATEEPMALFKKEKVLDKISGLPFLDKKIMENMIDSMKKELLKISGAFFLLDTKEPPKEKKGFLPENEIDFSLKEIFRSAGNFIQKFFSKKKIKKKNPFLKFKIPKIKIKEEIRKGLILLLILTIILGAGFIIFREGEKRNIEEIESRIEDIKAIIALSSEIISLGRNEEAFDLLLGIYKEISEENNPRFNQIKEEINSELEKMSRIENLENPNPITIFDIKDFVPQKTILYGNNIYLYTPFSEKIVEINISTLDRKYYTAPGKPGSAAVIDDMPIFFAKPDIVFGINNGNIIDLGRLKLPSLESDLTNFISFGTSLYFRDSYSGEILRYGSVVSSPENWLIPETKKPTDIQSMSADGFIWILKPDNTVSKYYAGSYIQDITLNVFPRIKKLSHISVSAQNPHIFLLEPAGNRLIIADKRGNIIKQFRSDKFSNLIHFWVSNDGKELFLLNSLEVYRILI